LRISDDHVVHKNSVHVGLFLLSDVKMSVRKQFIDYYHKLHWPVTS